VSARRRRPEARLLAIEITPMIDVVFLLIIFFMTTAQYARISRADLELPREPGEQEERSDEAGLVVNLLEDGSLVIQQTTVTLEELDAAIRAAAARETGGSIADVRLMLRADRRADAGRLNAVLDHLSALGVRSTRMATEVP